MMHLDAGKPLKYKKYNFFFKKIMFSELSFILFFKKEIGDQRLNNFFLQDLRI